MPHIVIKLWPGKSEKQKKQLVECIVKDSMDVLGYGQESFSVGIEEIDANEWADQIYEPEIKAKWDTLYKRPGYEM